MRAGLAFTPIGRGYNLAVAAATPVPPTPEPEVPVAPVNVVVPVISGTVQFGATLTTTDGTWTGSPTSFAYQWLADGVEISGATASTLLLTGAEIDTAITVRVIATNSVGSTGVTSSPTAAVAGPPIVLSLNPVFENTLVGTVVGVLTVPGTIGTPIFALDDDASGTFVLNDNLVELAAGLDYEIATSHSITVSVTGIAPTIDPQTFVIDVIDVDEVSPLITSLNTAVVAENDVLIHALTANETVTWTIIGGADAALFEINGFDLRWLANGTQDYETPIDADADNNYVVQVRATDPALNTASQTVTVTVYNVLEAPTNTVAPVISGTPMQGQTLSVTDGTWIGDVTITYTYAWYADGVPIAGATANTFEPTADEVGMVVQVLVTATNGAGSASITSNSTIPIVTAGGSGGEAIGLLLGITRAT